MDLHYSQTSVPTNQKDPSLNPLWIYTTLKHNEQQLIEVEV